MTVVVGQNSNGRPTSPYTDHTFELKAGLGEPAFDDLLARLAGLLALARGAPVPGFTR